MARVSGGLWKQCLILTFLQLNLILCASVCVTAVVDSVASAQALRGCTVIEGYLEIQIRGGSKYR